MSEDELIGTRLYTGPCFVKYNAVLRGVRSKCSIQFARWFASCKGNQYTTTLHIMNSGIGKLSKLTVAQRVYRGIAGGVLPPEFWAPNEYSVKGGVEFAFLSTTTDYNIALRCAWPKPALLCCRRPTEPFLTLPLRMQTLRAVELALCSRSCKGWSTAGLTCAGSQCTRSSPR